MKFYKHDINIIIAYNLRVLKLLTINNIVINDHIDWNNYIYNSFYTINSIEEVRLLYLTLNIFNISYNLANESVKFYY